MQAAFDPLEFLVLARTVANRGDEVGFRTGIGRAYYALFLLARTKLHARPGRNVHTEVIRAVRARPGYRAAGDQLDQLRRLRAVADYELDPIDPSRRNWMRNWADTEVLVDALLPKLDALP